MNRVLLDTHVFVWALAEPARLSAEHWSILEGPQNTLELSVASAWELAVKSALGKISLPGGVRAFVADGCRAGGVTLLGIELGHLDELQRLPQHHRDPFDRMIIAQARAESIAVVSLDRAFDQYNLIRAL